MHTQSPDVASRNATEALERCFSGKRAAERVAGLRSVELEGAHGRVPGVAHDLSEGGCLVEVTGDEYASAAAAGRIADCLVLVERQFGGGLRVWFGEDPAGGALPIALDAEVVRMTVGPDPHDGVRIGCRFLRMPGGDERRRLGLAPRRDRRTGWVPRKRVPNALLFATTGRLLGPVCAAKVVGVDGTRVALRVEGPHPDEVVPARLGAPEVRLEVLRGSRVAWETPARIVESRPDAAAPGALALELEVEVPAPRALLRGFRRRS